MKCSELPKKLKDWIDGKVTEHADGSISVDGHVRWFDDDLTEIPIKFRRVTGDFNLSGNNLTSLKNAPDWISGSFNCGRNKLTSLEHAPKQVGGEFWCVGNKLTSLDGLGEVAGEIYCNDNLVPEEELLAEYRRKRARKELTGESLAVDSLCEGDFDVNDDRYGPFSKAELQDRKKSVLILPSNSRVWSMVISGPKGKYATETTAETRQVAVKNGLLKYAKNKMIPVGYAIHGYRTGEIKVSVL